MHNICHYTYPENVDKKKVFNELNTMVERICWQEGGSLSPIRWNATSTICPDREAAEKWIESQDKGWYDCLAVKFYERERVESEKHKQLVGERVAAYNEYEARGRDLYCKRVTSALITCKTCGSKLSREYLKSNSCPVCHGELRPDHMLKWVDVAKKRLERARKAVEDYEAKHAKKHVSWLVKIEYHT